MAIPIGEATKVIRDMAQLMNPDADYMTIVAAEEHFTARDIQLKKSHEDTLNTLRALSKTLEAARASAQRPTSVPSAQDHEETLQELEEGRISLAKAISDADSALGSKEHELAALKDEVRQLEAYDPASEHERELDGTPLRLQLYKRLGFEPVLDKNGNPVKFFIRTLSGDIRVVDIDDQESPFERASRMFQVAAT